MPELAILGGTPLVRGPKAVRWPVITSSDKKAVENVLDSGIVFGAYSVAVATKASSRFLSRLRDRTCPQHHGLLK